MYFNSFILFGYQRHSPDGAALATLHSSVSLWAALIMQRAKANLVRVMHDNKNMVQLVL